LPRTVNVPTLRKHPKGSVVVLDDKYFYCGPFASAEATQKYDRLIAQWLANGRQLPSPEPDRAALTIGDPLLAYWRSVKTYCVRDGRPTSEQDTIRQALRFVRKLCGSTPAAAFTPLALKAVRQTMIDHPITHKVKIEDKGTGEVRWETRVLRHGLSRRVINKQIGRIKRMCGEVAVVEALLPAGDGAGADEQGGGDSVPGVAVGEQQEDVGTAADLRIVEELAARHPIFCQPEAPAGRTGRGGDLGIAADLSSPTTPPKLPLTARSSQPKNGTHSTRCSR
jgi:hypothetical protein